MSTLLGSEVSVVVQLFCHVRLFVTPWMAAHQASRSFTISWSLLRLMSIELMMPSSHLNLCHPLLLLPSIVPIIRVFSNDSALCSRWPKYWSFSCSTSPSNEYSELICLELTGLIFLLSKGLSRVFSSTTVQNHQFFDTQQKFLRVCHIYRHCFPQPLQTGIWEWSHGKDDYYTVEGPGLCYEVFSQSRYSIKDYIWWIKRSLCSWTLGPRWKLVVL